jgi:hypothetical protein
MLLRKKITYICKHKGERHPTPHTTMANALRLVQVNTTAFDEEDFLLVTNLSDEEIEKVITPIVMKERDEEVMYNNLDLVEAIRKAYPNRILIDYTPNTIDLIQI